jgi:serine/threonine-protein kinase
MSAPAAAKGSRRISPRIGRYRMVTPIAAGGMATVHLARIDGQGGFSRLVALKLLHSHLVEDQDFAAMFLDEARFAARIRHPNVVDVYDVERVDGELLIAMQYVEGAPLSALLRAAQKRQQGLPLGVTLAVAHDLLTGLHAAHELRDESGEPMGLVHRDVSPHNVLVGVDGLARVTDFGVAKARGRMVTTQGGAVKGKLRYLSPEQIQGASLDRRVDVFAAGIVLWELITARPLFAGRAEADTMMAVLTAPIPLPSRFAPELPIAVERVCMRALERDRDKRFATAAEFAEALEEAASKQIAKRRDVTLLVEELHAEELARLRSALASPAERVDAAYAGASHEPPTPAGMTPEPDASDTRSARPITTAGGARSPRRLSWVVIALASTALALGVGYYLGLGRPRPSEPDLGTAVAAALEPPKSAAVPPAEVAPARDPAPSASASFTAPPARAPARRPRGTPKPATGKPSLPTSKPGTPFMPGAL